MSLQREYRRDVNRFLSGQRDVYPSIPSGYFDAETEQRLARFERRARTERRPAQISEFPSLTLRPDIAGTAAKVIFRDWLEYLAGR